MYFCFNLYLFGPRHSHGTVERPRYLVVLAERVGFEAYSFSTPFVFSFPRYARNRKYTQGLRIPPRERSRSLALSAQENCPLRGLFSASGEGGIRSLQLQYTFRIFFSSLRSESKIYSRSSNPTTRAKPFARSLRSRKLPLAGLIFCERRGWDSNPRSSFTRITP